MSRIATSLVLYALVISSPAFAADDNRRNGLNKDARQELIDAGLLQTGTRIRIAGSPTGNVEDGEWYSL